MYSNHSSQQDVKCSKTTAPVLITSALHMFVAMTSSISISQDKPRSKASCNQILANVHVTQVDYQIMIQFKHE
jgi:hypothetical protein